MDHVVTNYHPENDAERYSIAPTPAASMMKCGTVTARYPSSAPLQAA